MIGDDRFVFSSDNGNNLLKLCAGDLSKSGGVSQVYDDVFVLGNTIRSIGGYTYFCTQHSDGEYAADSIIRLYHTFEGFSSMIYLIAAKLKLACPNPLRFSE